MACHRKDKNFIFTTQHSYKAVVGIRPYISPRSSLCGRFGIAGTRSKLLGIIAWYFMKKKTKAKVQVQS